MPSDVETAVMADLRQPLLASDSPSATIREPPAIVVTRSAAADSADSCNAEAAGSLSGPIVNLSCTIIGSGIIALPKSFEVLGVLLGVTVMLSVSILSHISISGLIRASLKSHAHTYSSVVYRFFGAQGSAVLKMMMILNCGGILIVYMVMICDILVGKEDTGFQGVLPSILGTHVPGQLVTSRSGILAITIGGVLGPVAFMREMSSVSITSSVGLAAVMYLVVTVVLLCVAAAWQGKLATDWTWLPNLGSMGKDESDAILQIVATVPVVMSAFVCHQSVHPVMSQIHPLTAPRMNTVVVSSLILCSILYILTAGSGYLVFGAGTKSDVLENFTLSAMDRILPTALAYTVSYSIRLVFSVALMMAFPLSHFAYRDNLCEILFQRQATDLPSPRFYGLTCLGLLGFYLTACTLPNIWLPLAIVGSTAGVTVAFIFPAMLMMSMDSHNATRQAYGAFLFATGLAVSISGLYSTLAPLLL